MPGRNYFAGLPGYTAAAASVAIAFLIRWLLGPLFGNGSFIFSAFYPAVVLTTYFAGTRPAILAAALSATMAYTCFAGPAFGILSFNVEALTSLLFFSLTSAVDIYFITGMAQALAELKIERARAESLAQGQASLFREFNERTTHHLQLVSALLQRRAEDDIDRKYARALVEASARTMEISRGHRILRGDLDQCFDFLPLLQQLVDNWTDHNSLRNVAIEIEGEDLRLPVEQTTSIAIIMFEFLRIAIDPIETEGFKTVQLRFEQDRDLLRIEMISWGGNRPSNFEETELFSGQLLHAMADQLGGTYSLEIIEDDLRLAVTVPQPQNCATAPKVRTHDLDVSCPLSTTVH